MIPLKVHGKYTIFNDNRKKITKNLFVGSKIRTRVSTLHKKSSNRYTIPTLRNSDTKIKKSYNVCNFFISLISSTNNLHLFPYPIRRYGQLFQAFLGERDLVGLCFP